MPNIKNWMWIFGVPAVIILMAKTITVWADMPNRVQKIEGYIETQQRSNEIQQQANDLMQQMIQQQKEVIYSPDGKMFYSEKFNKWLPVKKGK